jgi:hypothetical protein
MGFAPVYPALIHEIWKRKFSEAYRIPDGSCIHRRFSLLSLEFASFVFACILLVLISTDTDIERVNRA